MKRFRVSFTGCSVAKATPTSLEPPADTPCGERAQNATSTGVSMYRHASCDQIG
ncbi:hypothetical protein ABLO16_20140 [Mycobacterium tuberculosis]